MKIFCMWLFVVLLVTAFPGGREASAITSVGAEKVEASAVQLEIKESSIIYLLDWKENKLHTSKGVFVTDGVKVINNSGIEQQNVAKAVQPPVVELVVKDGVVQEITLLKHR